MAKQNKKVAEPAAKGRKTSSVKVRTLQDAKPFLTYDIENTKKLNELTEEEMVAQGYRYPLLNRPNFAKTEAERAELKAVKRKIGHRQPSAPPFNYRATPKRCVVQLESNEKFNGKNPQGFHNIKTADLRPFEIPGFIDSLNTKKATVIKYTYDGKTVEVGKEK